MIVCAQRPGCCKRAKTPLVWYVFVGLINVSNVFWEVTYPLCSCGDGYLEDSSKGGTANRTSEASFPDFFGTGEAAARVANPIMYKSGVDR